MRESADRAGHWRRRSCRHRAAQLPGVDRRLHGHYVDRRHRRGHERLVVGRRTAIRHRGQRPQVAFRGRGAYGTARRAHRSARRRSDYGSPSPSGDDDLGGFPSRRFRDDARTDDCAGCQRHHFVYVRFDRASQGRALDAPRHCQRVVGLGVRRCDRRRAEPGVGGRRWSDGTGAAGSASRHPHRAAVPRHWSGGATAVLVSTRTQSRGHVQVGCRGSASDHRRGTHHGVQRRAHHGLGTRAVAESKQIRSLQLEERRRRRRANGAGTCQADRQDHRQGRTGHRLGHDRDARPRHHHRRRRVSQPAAQLRPVPCRPSSKSRR